MQALAFLTVKRKQAMNQVCQYKGPLTYLLAREVFVFGCNPQGFHGAGAAGYASFGVGGNHWRAFDYASKPGGWKGNWNEKGKTGPMEGTEGKSYGLVTIAQAGKKRSLPLPQLRRNIKEFYRYARQCPRLLFFVAQTTQTGLNGYTASEMAEAFASFPIPRNVAFQISFARLLNKLTSH